MMEVLVQLFPDDQDQAWTFLFIPDDMVISFDSVGIKVTSDGENSAVYWIFLVWNKDNLNPTVLFVYDSEKKSLF